MANDDDQVETRAKQLMEELLLRQQVDSNADSIEAMKAAYSELAGLVADHIQVSITDESFNAYTKKHVGAMRSLNGRVELVDGELGLLKVDTASMKLTMGDDRGGLVKDVADLEGEVVDIEKAVGDDRGGLVRDVASIKKAVGDDSSGLVQAVASIKTTVGDSDKGLVKDVASVKRKIGNKERGLIKDVADLKKQSLKRLLAIGGTAGAGGMGAVKGVLELLTYFGG